MITSCLLGHGVLRLTHVNQADDIRGGLWFASKATILAAWA